MESSTHKPKVLKGWNIRLKVSSDEERKIKMKAIQKGMKISEYIKQTLLDSLSNKELADSGKSN